MKRIFSTIGSWGSVALAVFCPVCIPAIGAFLGSVGLSALALSAVVHPLLAVFLGLALLRFVLGYRRHRNPWPLTVGVVGAVGLYAGKWLVFSMPILYAGAALLIASSIVDTVLLRRASTSCALEQSKSASAIANRSAAEGRTCCTTDQSKGMGIEARAIDLQKA